MTPHELASEIWLKLVASAPTAEDPSQETLEVTPDEWSADPMNPERDGRVTWLIAEIGGSGAIRHRYEDMQRERYGRGRRLRQPDDEGEPRETGDAPDDRTESLKELDGLRVWRGLLVTAGDEFRPQDDVSLLLRLLADKPDILDDSSGGQWPVKRMVALLSERPPPRSWSEDQVDNAKRRLMNWIGRLMRKHGLDATDLEALFAAVARKTESSKTKPPGEKPSRVLN